MIKIAMVGLGGGLGAICRYLVYETYLSMIKEAWLPLGTITVNVTGCLAIGLLGGIAETRDIFTPEMRALIFIGFLGGFTTFSTFGFELFFFLRNGQPGLAALNIFIQLTAGLLAVWAGFSLARLV
ncbi:MAG TPA: fluoride efflux transporter CrcB [Desulfobacteraceae bacterium]|nr:fluoride efflux transporter CrcB [Desulfobacteraceae bacterium]